MQFRAGNNEARLNEASRQLTANQQQGLPGALFWSQCRRDEWRKEGDRQAFGKDYSVHRNRSLAFQTESSIGWCQREKQWKGFSQTQRGRSRQNDILSLTLRKAFAAKNKGMCWEAKRPGSQTGSTEWVNHVQNLNAPTDFGNIIYRNRKHP